MATYPVILDSRPPFLAEGAWPGSLLLTPVGAQPLLREVASRLSKLGCETPLVLCAFEPDARYLRLLERVAPHISTVARLDRFGELHTPHEPSDLFLLIDAAAYSPTCFPAAEAVRSKLNGAAAVHVTACEAGPPGARECVQLDAEGRVRRIERYYEGVTWTTAAGVACSLMSVAALRMVELGSFKSLASLRSGLARHGAVTRDLLLAEPIVDLSDERGLLAVMTRFVRRSRARSASHGNELRGEALVASGCEIHPSVRLLGPVIVQRGARIEAGATIIGPALIGEEAHVVNGATVTQSLILPRTTVPAEALVRERVFSGRRAAAHGDTPEQRSINAWPVATSASASDMPASRIRYAAFKRSADFVVALTALLVLSPLLAVVALLVRLSSKGPIFFAHEREGLNGRAFRCWKFRTMVPDAHAMQRSLYKQNQVDGPQFKLDVDPRITPVGRWLRLTNIDELPQLYNVLTGEMSLIGPRPSPFRENQICVPWRRGRLSVRPGITGLWQLCRSDRQYGDFHQWIHYDLLYVRHMSLWLDLKILAGTLCTFGGRWSWPLAWLIPAQKLAASGALAAELSYAKESVDEANEVASPLSTL